jgi:molecular chaperone GrpE
MAGGMEEKVIAGLSRDQLLSRFEEWLDNALTTEQPPEGIEAEILSALTSGTTETPDQTSSYALWAAMTALSQEVKLQGRAFKELAATLDSQPERITDEIRSAYREREHDIQREAERRCRREILGSLLDLRDRLERGVQSAKQSIAEISKASRRGWRARLFGSSDTGLAEAPVAAVIRGYELGLERLDQTLESFNARPITALGQPFEPRRMNAIDTQESETVPEGTVLEVYRTGYEWNGEVFRPAQGKVSVLAKGLHEK